MTRGRTAAAVAAVGALTVAVLLAPGASPPDPPQITSATAATSLPVVRARLTGPMPEIVVHGAAWPHIAAAAAYRLFIDGVRQADQLPNLCTASVGKTPCATQGFAQPIGCGAAHRWNVAAVAADGTQGPLMPKPLVIPKRPCP